MRKSIRLTKSKAGPRARVLNSARSRENRPAAHSPSKMRRPPNRISEGYFERVFRWVEDRL